MLVLALGHTPPQRMPIILVKLYTYQMLRALAHIHSIGVCHRWGLSQGWLMDAVYKWLTGPSRRLLEQAI